MASRSHRTAAVTTTLMASVAMAMTVSALAAGTHHRDTGEAGVNCGGSGVNSLYCIPEQSVFAFAHVGKSGRCSLTVHFTVEPKIEGLHGHARLQLRGLEVRDRSVKRDARPIVGGGAYSYVFKSLTSGSYKLSGWYEGDGTRLPSAHRSIKTRLRCG